MMDEQGREQRGVSIKQRHGSVWGVHTTTGLEDQVKKEIGGEGGVLETRLSVA